MLRGEVIGKGASGHVIKAINLSSGKTFAIKIIRDLTISELDEAMVLSPNSV
jgi:serine/threonine protein kinase